MYRFVLAPEVGTFSVLQEIELSTSPACAVALDEVKFAVTFALPVSRTDPIAIEGEQHDTPCCYLALSEQLDWVDRAFPEARCR